MHRETDLKNVPEVFFSMPDHDDLNVLSAQAFLKAATPSSPTFKLAQDDQEYSSGSSSSEIDRGEFEFKARIDFDSISRHFLEYQINSPSLKPKGARKSKDKINRNLSSIARVIFYSQTTGVLKAKKFEHLDFSDSRSKSPESSFSSASGDSLQSAQPSIANILKSNPFWIDFTSPTIAEVNSIARLFGIHPLTAEDIHSTDTREKCETFPAYNYIVVKSFDQDPFSFTYLQAVNVNIVTFESCVLTVHLSNLVSFKASYSRIKCFKTYRALEII